MAYDCILHFSLYYKGEEGDFLIFIGICPYIIPGADYCSMTMKRIMLVIYEWLNSDFEMDD